MKVLVYSCARFERPFLDQANEVYGHDLVFLDTRLTAESAALAAGYEGVSIYANDDASAKVLQTLAANGTKLLALRCAGFNHVDLTEARKLGLTVLRVPAYSPYSVAEHAAGLMLTLNRKFHRAFNRVREQNFSLDGLMGFDMHGRTAGIVGLGTIGRVMRDILLGFGCNVIYYDPQPSTEGGGPRCESVSLEKLFQRSDILTLHCPLTPETRHLIDRDALKLMKTGVMIINTSRGAVIDTLALVEALKSGKVGSVGLDVYEEETGLFPNDLSAKIITDDLFVRLMTFPNVLLTAHQGFFTREAVTAIAETTLTNISNFEHGRSIADNRVN